MRWKDPRGKLRVFIVPMILIAILLTMAGCGVMEIINSFRYNKVKLNYDELGISAELAMDAPDGITNIALFGIDARNDSFRGLSDSIMVISIDAVHNDIKIISVMRDSLVEVEGFGYQKINAAYNLGGAPLAIKTLNQTFKLNITDYATVDFVGMAEIIEAVGGIEVELTEAEVQNANVHIRSMHRERGTAEDYIEQAGMQKLNGVQAVAFSRIRKVATVNGTNNDPGRTERQRLVMRQMFDKALSMRATQYPRLIKALLPYMETSLDYDEIFELAGILVNEGLQFKEARMPSFDIMIEYGKYVPGLGSCCYYNLDYAAKQMNAFIFEDISFEQYIEENGVDLTRWYPESGYQSDDSSEEEEPIVEQQPTVEEPIIDNPPTAEEPPIADEPTVDEPIVGDEPIADDEPTIADDPIEEEPNPEVIPSDEETLE
ncbi:MAG: LCP family protein [Clostridia bacterium]|nr:LCP family protein [Clostridia bacterium]